MKRVLEKYGYHALLDILYKIPHKTLYKKCPFYNYSLQSPEKTCDFLYKACFSPENTALLPESFVQIRPKNYFFIKIQKKIFCCSDFCNRQHFHCKNHAGILEGLHQTNIFHNSKALLHGFMNLKRKNQFFMLSGHKLNF